MGEKAVNYYEPCDKAIQILNRLNLEAFGQLKMIDLDRVNVIQTVIAVYQKSIKQIRKRYYDIAFEAYMLAIEMCGATHDRARKMAHKAITLKWVDRVLTQTDFVTLYRFDTEAERKAYKLAETLEVSRDKDYEINKALRYWSQQIGQYAINVTDYAVLTAFDDYGIEEVKWISEHDLKVCNECYAYDGQIFSINEIPAKPHWGCRCRFKPIIKVLDS